MATETGALAPDKMMKLARMELHGVPRKQTAMSMALSEGRITQIIDTPEYEAAAAIVASENFDENELINRGWDGIEALGITTVVRALKNDPDPDFALKAAIYANKAARRGGFAQNPIAAHGAGVRTIIQLNSVFVDKLQQNFEITKDRTSVLIEKQKDSDFLGARAVQDLLKMPLKNKELEQENSLAGLLSGTEF